MVNESSSIVEPVPKVNDEDVAGRLQLCIHMFGSITATKIAEEIGVSVSAVTKWLRTGRITRPHLVAFSFRYQINLLWLMTGLGPMKYGSGPGASDSLVPVYPLSGWALRGAIPIYAHAEAVVGYIHCANNPDTCFAIAASCPEVDPRIRDGTHFLFRPNEVTPKAGELVAIFKKKGVSELLLRIAAELPDGSIEYVASSNRVPSFVAADVNIAGVCVSSVNASPTFF